MADTPIPAPNPTRAQGFRISEPVRRATLDRVGHSDTRSVTLSERDSATYVGFSTAALRIWRRAGRGPAYLRFNRNIRYRVVDLDAWLQAHLVQTGDSRKLGKVSGDASNAPARV